MLTDRFKNYDAEVRELVLTYEERRGQDCYFDVDQMMVIIDFYLEQTDLDLLEEAVAYAEKLFPNDDEVRLRKSHLYSIKGQNDKALAILQDLERIDPSNTDVQYALGAVYSVLNQSQRAIRHYLRAAADGYQLDMVYGNIADEYYKLAMDDDAEHYYRMALAKNVNEERSLYNLTKVYCDIIESGNTNVDVAYFEKLVDDNPYSKQGWFCLGMLYRSLGLCEKAIDALEYAQAIDDSCEAIYRLKAECYELMGSIPEAVRELRESITFAEDCSDVYYNIAQLYASNNNLNTALIYVRKALDEDAYNFDAWMLRATCYARTNDIYSSLESAERALTINPQSAWAMWLAGTMHQLLNSFEKAEQMFECALKLEPETDLYWVAMADLLISLERYDDAASYLCEGLTYAALPAEFYKRLAKCYFCSGRRNLLFNALRDYMHQPDADPEGVYAICPQLRNDIEAVNILTSTM